VCIEAAECVYSSPSTRRPRWPRTHRRYAAIRSAPDGSGEGSGRSIDPMRCRFAAVLAYDLWGTNIVHINRDHRYVDAEHASGERQGKVLLDHRRTRPPALPHHSNRRWPPINLSNCRAVGSMALAPFAHSMCSPPLAGGRCVAGSTRRLRRTGVFIAFGLAAICLTVDNARE
jgi:hypothetical protein